MPNRQYYCWKLCLKFHCGCVQYTSTQHVCNAHRGVQCNQWMITRTTDKDCDTHRTVGLHDGSSDEGQPAGEDHVQEEQADQRRVQSEEFSRSHSGRYEQAPRRRARN